jgi:hypothetical protein
MLRYYNIFLKLWIFTDFTMVFPIVALVIDFYELKGNVAVRQLSLIELNRKVFWTEADNHNKHAHYTLVHESASPGSMHALLVLLVLFRRTALVKPLLWSLALHTKKENIYQISPRPWGGQKA